MPSFAKWPKEVNASFVMSLFGARSVNPSVLLLALFKLFQIRQFFQGVAPLFVSQGVCCGTQRCECHQMLAS
jgi:hypothetical protein